MRHTRTYTAGTVNRHPHALLRTGRWGTLAGVALALLAAPTIARAQSAIIYGSLGNFDISLTATPPAGKQFLSWGGACAGTADTCTVTMTANLSAQADFRK